MDIMEPHAADILTVQLADARERINQTQLALERTEEMLAENIALRKRMRCLVEAASSLVKINPPSNEGRRAG